LTGRSIIRITALNGKICICAERAIAAKPGLAKPGLAEPGLAERAVVPDKNTSW
jgi:hypothetical protein